PAAACRNWRSRRAPGRGRGVRAARAPAGRSGSSSAFRQRRELRASGHARPGPRRGASYRLKYRPPSTRRQRATSDRCRPQSSRAATMPASPPPPRFRREVRTTAVLAAPLVAGHLATGLIGFVDNVIAGRHGTNTLAGVAVGTAMFWLPMMVPMGTLMALPPSVSQLDGAGRRAEVGPLFRQALWLSLMLGLLLFACLSLSVHALEPLGIA